MPKNLTKLTPVQYEEILNHKDSSHGSTARLARKYGVDEKTIRKIRKGEYKVYVLDEAAPAQPG